MWTSLVVQGNNTHTISIVLRGLEITKTIVVASYLFDVRREKVLPSTTIRKREHKKLTDRCVYDCCVCELAAMKGRQK